MRAPRVIFVDAEAALPIHLERAKAWGIDTRRLLMKLPDRNGAIDFSSAAQRDCLCDEVARNCPELVIIDSLSNISSRGENDIEDVRELMMFFTHLSLDFEIGLLLIHHFRKGLVSRPRGSYFSMDDVRGSGHIIAAARSLIGLRIVPNGDKFDPNGPRQMEILKTNLCPYPSPLGLGPSVYDGYAAQSGDEEFARLLADWSRLTEAINAINRSMGLADAYPFALNPLPARKLAFVHALIRCARESK